ncbi:hypothetical protein [Solidesulfovibrio sp.]|uniref:TadE/TadG family type IV pilus assembly protein n=1 Tax=Solidesulfovibrio sp. TaxID=2910990 RepID=UPI0026210144|nr:hypothetical protein [Solidesulfovibrio sp.]
MRRPGGKPSRLGRDQRGQAMIEAAFMLFWLSFALMFFLWGRTLYENMARTEEELRYDLRKELDKIAGDSFRRVEKKAEATLKVPGVIGEKLGENPIRVPLRLIGYGGSYTGRTESEYFCYYRKRKISE